jgi:hypothetical protein
MGQGSGLLIPRLNAVPLVHRLVADDRLAVMLAKTLVELDIAVPGDWKRAEHDPTSFIRITLERWIHTHGGPAIRHRFLLSAVISNTPCEWAERDETKPNQLFLIVEPFRGNLWLCELWANTEAAGERPPATTGDLLPPLCRCSQSLDQDLRFLLSTTKIVFCGDSRYVAFRHRTQVLMWPPPARTPHK